MLALSFREAVSECTFGTKEVPPLERDSSYVSCCHPRRVGRKHIILCGNVDSSWPMKWMVGPDFPAVLLVFVLILVISLPSITLSGIVIGWYVAVPMVALLITLLIAYSATACSDPGIVYGNNDGKPIIIGDNRVVPTTDPTQESSGISDVEMAAAVANTVESITNSTNTNSEVVDAASDNSGAVGISTTDDSTGVDIESSSSAPASSSSSSSVASSSLTQSNNSYNNNNNNYNNSTPSTIECSSCDIQRPFTATHCAYCGVCIDKLDHHCPWSGQCIGRNNMLPFQIFVSLIGVMCWFCVGASIYAVYLLARYHD